MDRAARLLLPPLAARRPARGGGCPRHAALKAGVSRWLRPAGWTLRQWSLISAATLSS